jgi:hypothetical protein
LLPQLVVAFEFAEFPHPIDAVCCIYRGVEFSSDFFFPLQSSRALIVSVGLTRRSCLFAVTQARFGQDRVFLNPQNPYKTESSFQDIRNATARDSKC